MINKMMRSLTCPQLSVPGVPGISTVSTVVVHPTAAVHIPNYHPPSHPTPTAHHRPYIQPQRYIFNKWSDTEVKENCDLIICNDAYWFATKTEVIKCLDLAFGTKIAGFFNETRDSLFEYLQRFKRMKECDQPVPFTTANDPESGVVYYCKYLEVRDWYNKN